MIVLRGGIIMDRMKMLSKIPLFSSLPDDLKSHLSTIVNPKVVAKGEVLFREQQKAEGLYFIISGKVKLMKSNPEGKEILLNVRKTGEMFAEVPLFNKAVGTYPVTATAIESSTIAIIRYDDLENILMEEPHLSTYIFRVMAERLQVAQNTLRDVALYGKFGAMASTLVRLCEDYGVEDEEGIVIKLRLTHEDLGSFFGATRESVTRMINQLKQQGVLDKKGNYFIIYDLDVLNSYLDGK